MQPYYPDTDEDGNHYLWVDGWTEQATVAFVPFNPEEDDEEMGVQGHFTFSVPSNKEKFRVSAMEMGQVIRQLHSLYDIAVHMSLGTTVQRVLSELRDMQDRAETAEADLAALQAAGARP